MGLTHVAVALKGLGASNGTYEADFLVDTGATDCFAPAAKLRQIGVQAVGAMVYELQTERSTSTLSVWLKSGSWVKSPPAG